MSETIKKVTEKDLNDGQEVLALYVSLKGAESIIRNAMFTLASKQSNTALNEILRAAKDYSNEKI